MERPSINEIMMETALLFAQRSTCARVKAGAVISVDNHIVSTGYNGNAPGKEHCYDYFYKLWQEENSSSNISEFTKWLQTEDFKERHRKFGIRNELHAEMNAIIYAGKRGISVAGGKIYTTYSPCLFCVKAIIQAGIKEVYYHIVYDRPEGYEALDVLAENNIKVECI
jgi:dCMP deaminase